MKMNVSVVCWLIKETRLSTSPLKYWMQRAEWPSSHCQRQSF
uniref:Uncharacterized protein n=1 Tax=Arundo donax TaxID=35708 RepID=A0A0A9FNA3_ARUDO